MPDNRKKVLAISGSTRNNSINKAILQAIAAMYQESLDIQLYNELAELPHFNPDLDIEPVPLKVLHFRRKIAEADGILICTPEYVFSLPGALKNAIEWTVSTTVFAKKPLALIVASGLGQKAYEALLLIMNTVEAHISPDAALLISGAGSKIDSSGRFTDADTLQNIGKLVASLCQSMNMQASGS